MPEWGEEGSSQTPSSDAGQPEGDRENCHHEDALWSPALPLVPWCYVAFPLNPHHHPPLLQVKKPRTAGEENDLAEVDCPQRGPTQPPRAPHTGRGLTGGPLHDSRSSLTRLSSPDWKTAILGLVEGIPPPLTHPPAPGTGSGALGGKLRVGSENRMFSAWLAGGDGPDTHSPPEAVRTPHSPHYLPLPAMGQTLAGEGRRGGGIHQQRPDLPARGWRPNKAGLAAEAPPRRAHILLPCKARRRAPPPPPPEPAPSRPGAPHRLRTRLRAPSEHLLHTRWEPPAGPGGLEHAV